MSAETCPRCHAPLAEGHSCPPSGELSAEMTAAVVRPSSGDRPLGAPGTVFDHFEFQELIGRGGFGEVYRARDTRLGRTVAVKVLPEHVASDAERRERFVREAKAASALNHPGICTVHDLVESNGRHLLVMEYVDGRPLHALLADGALPPERAIPIALQIADALDEAHRAGILHRDIKPGNVLVTPSGRVKVLDFGLAKRLGPATGEVALTREGFAVGTLHYMPPEQLLGNAVDARSDLYALGVVLYQMLTGRLPFAGSTEVAVVDAILHAPLKPPEGVPADLASLLKRLLARDPAHRPASAAEVRKELAALLPSAPAPRRRPVVLVAAVVVAAALLVSVGWLLRERSRARWAREVALPEIEKLVAEERFVEAVPLANRVKAVLPQEPALVRLLPELTMNVNVESEPPADVYARPLAGNGAWELVGRTPLRKHPIARANYLWRLDAPGYRSFFQIAPTQGVRQPVSLRVTLSPDKDAPPRMLRVTGGQLTLEIPGFQTLDPITIDDFLIDQLEVTNEDFKAFVDAGGYARREFWREPFVRGGREVPFEEAVALFHDTTGRPGPAGWELGGYPAGRARYPVGGVSWYEAAAYAAFAGKRLPSILHWNHAAQPTASALIVQRSNFVGGGPLEAGSGERVGGFGTYDMAGNVKEWCANADGEGRRVILGGAWNEPNYMFIDFDAQSPWDRRETYGLRCMLPLSEKGLADAAKPILAVARDFTKEKPIPDAVFEAYRGVFAYDAKAPAAVVEETRETPEWTRLKVRYDAAYGGERVPAYVYLPKNAVPPYQTVLFFPGSNALAIPNFEDYGLVFSEFVVRSGRVLVIPVYKGTFERIGDLRYNQPAPTTAFRDYAIAWVKDARRAVDYLATRPDVDMSRLGYYGFSWGASMGSLILAVDPRFKAAVFATGGLHLERALPEVDELNFAPRVTVPILMLNGRYDASFPVASSQEPLFRFLGTPAKDKKRIVYDSGHIPPRTEVIREALDWFDRYLGPVKKK